MSGILGIFGLDGAPIPAGVAESMLLSMAYRGPDGLRRWQRDNIAMGQALLATTPDARIESQPWEHPQTGCVVVTDSRLDDRASLLRALGLTHRPAHSIGDAELIHETWRRWGISCAEKLHGEFAFAIWDPHRQRLFCCRDRLGVKPLYFFRSESLFAFSSEEETFLHLPDGRNKPNERRIACLFFPEYMALDETESWLEDVYRLEPGHLLTIERNGKPDISRYWQLQPGAELRLANDAEYEEAFRSRFTDAVSNRLRGGEPVGLMLSGGIDSLSIAGCAAVGLPETTSSNFRCYSAVSDADGCTETANINAFLSATPCDATLVGVDDPGTTDLDEYLFQLAWSRAHPVDNSIPLPGLIYLIAGRGRTRIMLDGIDGDLVTWAPNDYVGRLLRAGSWREAWQEAGHASRNNTYLRQHTSIAIFGKHLIKAVAPWVPTRRPSTRSDRLVSAEFEQRIRPQLADSLDQYRRAGRAQAHLPIQDAHIHALTHAGISTGMEGYDRVAARFGVEPRHPWSDLGLVEFYLALPLRQKIRQGWTKYLVRQACAPWLPEPVRWHHGKDHLGWKLTQRLMRRSRQHVEGSILAAGPLLEGIIDLDIARSVVRRYDVRDAVTVSSLHNLTVLACWLRRISNPSSLPMADQIPNGLITKGARHANFKQGRD